MAIKALIKNVQIKVGDSIKVKHQFFVDQKPQFQTFEGIVIAIRGSGQGKSFTVRKISAGGIPVEKIWPFNCPNLISVKVIKSGNPRRAKLYYLRKRIGKNATKINQA